MNIPNLIDALKKQFDDVKLDVRMLSLPKKFIGQHNGILVNKEAGTILKDIKINLQYSTPIVSVYIVHNNCVRWTNGRKISTIPHFCKYCGSMPLDKTNLIDLGLPIKDSVAKMHIKVMGPNGYAFSGKRTFDVHNMHLYEDGQWWHKCSAYSDHTYSHTRMTIKKFPHKCKRCKMLIGDASFNLKTAFKLPSLVG